MANGRDTILTIDNLRGGMNSSDPATALLEDQATRMINVELHRTTVGAKRLGSEAVETLDSEGYEIPANSSPSRFFRKLHRHLPTDDQSEAELWAIAGPSGNFSNQITIYRRDNSTNTYTEVTPDFDLGAQLDMFVQLPEQFPLQTFNRKLFQGLRIERPNHAVNNTGDDDRLWVWDGTAIRRAGISQFKSGGQAGHDGTDSGITSVADTGGGSFATTRYYRIRYTAQDGSGVTLRRSEPGSVVTFSPSGAGSGALVTREALGVLSILSTEGITHWELEASLDGPDGNFYRIATTAIGTATATDTQSAAAGYSQDFTLSEPIGDYIPVPSANFLSVDEDRLLLGGSNIVDGKKSRVSWTPVLASPGVGNDERVPLRTTNFLDLDLGEGGELTGQVQAQLGVIYVFKWQTIYVLYRTGNPDQAYRAEVMTKARGAIPGSVQLGADAQGRPVVFFWDPYVGPCLIGPAGLARCGRDIEEKEAHRVNLDAQQIATSLYVPEEGQMRWWMATGITSTRPNEGFVLQLTHMQGDPNAAGGYRKGWTLWSGLSCFVHSAAPFGDNVMTEGPASRRLRPLVGTTGDSPLGSAAPKLLQTDAPFISQDAGRDYPTEIISRPYFVGSVLNRFGVMSGSVIGEASGVLRPIEIIQSVDTDEQGSLGTVPVAISPSTAGSTLVVGVMADGAIDDLSVSDPTHGAYPLLVSHVNTFTPIVAAIYQIENVQAGVTTITVSRAGGDPGRICVWELRNVRTLNGAGFEISNSSGVFFYDLTSLTILDKALGGDRILGVARLGQVVDAALFSGNFGMTSPMPNQPAPAELFPGFSEILDTRAVALEAVDPNIQAGLVAFLSTIVSESPPDYDFTTADSVGVSGFYTPTTLPVVVSIGVVRDFGLEEVTRAASFVPTALEDQVIRPLDDLSLSENTAIQLRIADPESGPEGIWRISTVALRIRSEQRA